MINTVLLSGWVAMAPVVMEHEEEVELFSRRLVRATWKLVLGSFLLHVSTNEPQESCSLN